MKFTKIITGCALAAGLMSFAPVAQAGIVLNNGLYANVNIKLTVVYASNGKLKKATVTNKQILSALYASTKDLTLVVGVQNSVANGDVFVYNTKTKTLGVDLTAESVLTIDNREFISTSKPGNNGGSATSNGTVGIAFYDSPSTEFGFDQVLSQEASANWFEVGGVYSAKGSQSSNKGNTTVTINVNAQATDLSGQCEITPNSTTGKSDFLPIYGSASAIGSGKLNQL